MSTLTPSGVLRALAAAIDADPDRWPGRDTYTAGADVDGLRDDEWLYVFPAAWARITGRPGGDVLAVLYARGDLHVPDANRRRDEWVAKGPRWAGRPSCYSVRRLAMANPAPDPDPSAPAGPVSTRPNRAKPFTGWPWDAPEPRAVAPEPCPDCGAPAGRTPQGTLTDCPSCGLVLTGGCRERVTAGEAAAARRTAPATVEAAPTLTDRLRAGIAARQLNRERDEVTKLYRDWAKALDPAGLRPPLDRMAASLADAFLSAASEADDAGSMAELADLRARIGRQLIRHADALQDRVWAARGQEPDDEPEYDDDEYDDDEYDTAAAAIAPAPEPRALNRTPALVPVCGRCGTDRAAARVDTAEPGHRIILGMTGYADVCERCGESLAGAAARMGVQLRMLADYAPARRTPAIRVPVVPAAITAGTRVVPSGPVLPGLPVARPLPRHVTAPPMVALPWNWRTARPADPVELTSAWAKSHREKHARPRCEIRPAHKVSVILGNALPAATVKVTGTGPDGPRTLAVCSDKCAERAARSLVISGHNGIVTEPIS